MNQNKQQRQVVFSPSFTKDIEAKLLTSEYQTLLNSIVIQKRWYGLKEQHELIQLFQFISKINCLQIIFSHNNYPNIIKGISFPIYTQLTNLFLRFDSIHNIEALTFINMERIKNLDVRDNRVVQAKALNKTRWPHVHTIHIGDNKFSEFNLDRMKMSHYLQDFTVRDTCKIQSHLPQRALFFKLQPSHLPASFYNFCQNSSIKIYKAIAMRYLLMQ